MDSINFKSGVEIEASHLNANTKFLQDAVKAGLTHTRSAGIIRNLSHNSTTTPTQFIWTDQSTLGVYGLTCVDSNGEVITVPGNKNDETPLIFGLLPNTTVDPSDESYLELTTTGQPLSDEVMYYMVIRYDSAVTGPVVPHVVSREPLSLGVTSSYRLFLRLSLLEGDIVLGTVKWGSDGKIVVSELQSQFSEYFPEDVIATRTAIDDITGVETTTNVSYPDHINDFDNPHKVTLAQLGLDMGDLLNHQAFMHDDGIRTTNIHSTTYALYPTYHTETQSDDSEAEYVTIKPLDRINNEFVVVNGKTIYPKDIGDSDTVISMSVLDAEGYYLIYLDSETKQITRTTNAVANETDAEFTSILTDRTKFPICSFKWAQESLVVDGVNTSSYNIITSTWKDRRVFKTSSIDNIHPDEVLALAQVAPNINCNYQIYNARLVGTTNQNTYNVAGKRLIITVDDVDRYEVVFAGNNPLPVSEIIYQINSVAALTDEDGAPYYELYVHLDTEGHLVFCAPLALSITVSDDTNNAASVLGFTSSNSISTSDTIKEVLISGDIEGRMVFDYNESDLVTSATYWFGGNKLRKQAYTYKDDNIIRIKDSVEFL